MEIIYKLIPIFIIWELLTLFGTHSKFSEKMSSFKPDESTILEILSYLGGVFSFLLVAVGYLIWVICGLIYTPHKFIFTIFIMFSIPSFFIGPDHKHYRVWGIVDPVVSILLFIYLFIYF